MTQLITQEDTILTELLPVWTRPKNITPKPELVSKANASLNNVESETESVVVSSTSTKDKVSGTQPKRDWKRGCYPRSGKLAPVDIDYIATRLGQPLNRVSLDLVAYLLRNREEFLEGLRLRLNIYLQDQAQLQEASVSRLPALVYELPFSYIPLPSTELKQAAVKSVRYADKFLLPVLLPAKAKDARGTGTEQGLTKTKPQMQLAAQQLSAITIINVLAEVLNQTCLTLPSHNLISFLTEQGIVATSSSVQSSIQFPQIEEDEQLQLTFGRAGDKAFGTPLAPGMYRPQVIEQVQNGALSLGQVAQLLSISRTSAYRLRKRGEPKYASVSDCQIFYGLLERKLTQRELAEKYGISERAVRKSFSRVMNKLVETLLKQS